MAENEQDQLDNDTETRPGPLPDEGQAIDRLPVTIHAQYIRDLSFENPNAPMPMRKSDGKPSVGVDLSMDARKIEIQGFENSYEVVVFVTVKASKGELTTFIAELEYGLAVSVENVPEDKVHPLLLIEMPNYMFPYVRQIISDMTQQAGYMPFMLSPVNFKALYRKQFGGPKPTIHERKPKAEKKKETA